MPSNDVLPCDDSEKCRTHTNENVNMSVSLTVLQLNEKDDAAGNTATITHAERSQIFYLLIYLLTFLLRPQTQRNIVLFYFLAKHSAGICFLTLPFLHDCTV